MTHLTVGAADSGLAERIDQELAVFNREATGEHNEQELSVRAEDENGDLVAGLTGATWGRICEIAMLWVRADRRTEGWGSRLLQAAEKEAVARGCTRIVLSSFTFQAPDFYRRHGYTETARTEGFPAGHARVHLQKDLPG
ncbi:GNAT family N-acetyltransferase [Kineosporia babensis]|uniref:GNAT family N-acetyltransferase n=1 Tax=Kineosporia babensis TaxID=499548 RepID=A0A9X1SSA1_9ACTN|nr:GNAT family N-acetyltransferase [Kineosporia babensis]MCD5310076.1 GNAT family N-acetyltransferase [Kineosporia babensis]